MFRCRASFRLLILTALALVACGPVPHAFKPDSDPEAHQAVIDRPFSRGVQVDPVDGAPKVMARLLARATADGFDEYNVPAGVAPFDNSEYILHGRAVKDTEPEAIPFVTINWQLSDLQGRVLADIVQPVDTTAFDWEFGSPKVITRVGEDIARRASAILAGIAPAEKGAQPQLGIFITPVEGTPGDGDVSLTRAIAEALKQRGTRLTRYRELARYVLEGTMSASEPHDGKQDIKILWRLSHTDGKEVGRATQENTVKAGLFEGKWGGTAALIAEAAVGGIYQMITAWEEGPGAVAGTGRGLTLPEDGADGDLPTPTRPQVLASMSDRTLPPAPDAGTAATTPSPADEAAKPKVPAKPPKPKSRLGTEDVGGEEPRVKVFRPPVLPKLIHAASDAFMIAGVDGAPGNGNDLLNQAMHRVLQARDQAVTDDPRQARFVIRGEVDLGTPKDGFQRARVVWFVAELDDEGEKSELGRIEQTSRVAAGSLDENWGKTAMDVALGAVPGLQKVLGDRARVYSMPRNGGGGNPADPPPAAPATPSPEQGRAPSSAPR